MRMFPGLVLLMGVAATMLRAATVVSPTAGSINSASGIPFLTDTNVSASVRYQQVYGASDFARQGSPQYLITELGFGGGPGGPIINVVLQNVEIYLSTTPRSVDSLSPVFADNLGPNNTLVFSGSIEWTIPGSGTFAFRIPLGSAFLYEWRAGNLLLEVRNYQTIPPQYEPPLGRTFEAVNTLGDTVSSIAAFDVNALTADSFYVNTRGLTTLFTVTGVPEPRSVLLLLTGPAALVVVARRRERRRQQARPSSEIR